MTGVNERPPLLDVVDISVSFGGVRAVDGVSLRISGGGIVGLVGPNGSGKTTFLNALTGVVPASGVVRVDGRPLALGRPAKSRAAGLVRMYQAPQLCPGLSCVENVIVGHENTLGRGLVGAWTRRRKMLEHEVRRWTDSVEAIDRVGLADRSHRLARELTYGEQRMTELARAMVANPKILMLDEPSAGLNDAETKFLSSILSDIAGNGVTLIIIDHKIDFIDALCSRVVVLESGRVIADAPTAEIWSDPRVIDAYLGAGHSATNQ
jgi:ABC-type branched-subunit amino acid transport system ATPase component